MDQLNENFDKLPQKIDIQRSTERALLDLRKQIEKLDKNTKLVKELDIKQKTPNEQEQILLNEINTRFKNYLEQIAAFEKTDLNLQQQALLKEIKLILADLLNDIAEYKKGNVAKEFENEYSAIIAFLKTQITEQDYYDLINDFTDSIQLLAENQALAVYKILLSEKIIPNTGTYHLHLAARIAVNIKKGNSLKFTQQLKTNNVLDDHSFEEEAKNFNIIANEEGIKAIILSYQMTGEKFNERYLSTYQSLAKLSIEDQKIALESYIKIKKLNKKTGHENQFTFHDLDRLIVTIKEKGKEYIDKLVYNLDGRMYKYPPIREKEISFPENSRDYETMNKYIREQREYEEYQNSHPSGKPIVYEINSSDIGQYDLYLALTDAEKTQVLTVGQEIVDRFNWLNDGNDEHFWGAKYILKLSQKGTEYREKLFTRLEKLNNKFNLFGCIFKRTDEEFHDMLMKLDDKEFEDFIGFVEKFKNTEEFVFTINRIDNYLRLQKTGAGEIALRISQEIPSFQATRVEIDVLVRVNALGKKEQDSFIEFLKKLAEQNPDFIKYVINYLKPHQTDFLIKVSKLNNSEVKQAIFIIIANNLGSLIVLLAKNIDNKEFQKVLIYISSLNKKDIEPALIILNIGITKGKKAKQIIQELQNQQKAKQIIEDAQNGEDIKQALKLLNKENLYKFDPANEMEYSNLSNLLGKDLYAKCIKYLNYDHIKGSVKQKMQTTSNPIQLLEEYFEYYKNKDRLTIPDELITQLSSYEKQNGKIIVSSANIVVIADFINRLRYISEKATKQRYTKPELEEIKINLISPLKAVFPTEAWNDIQESSSVYTKIFKLIEVNIMPSEINNLEKLYAISIISDESKKHNEWNRETNNQNLFNNFDPSTINVNALLQTLNCNLNLCNDFFTPEKLESIRNYLGKNIGYQKASQFILQIGQSFLDQTTVSYDNIQKFLEIAVSFKSASFDYENRDAETIYHLLGNFIFNKLIHFLTEKLGTEEQNIDMVQNELRKFNISLKDIELLLGKNGIAFSLKENNFKKGLKHLARGDFHYLLESTAEKIKEKISREHPHKKNQENISIERHTGDWEALKGVKMEGINYEKEEKAKLVSIERSSLDASLLLGTNEKRTFTPNEINPSRQMVITATLAFSTKQGEMTELAVKEGEPISILLNSNGKDALVLTNSQGDLCILDKRNLDLHDIYKIAKLSPKEPDRVLNITQKIEDYMLFMQILEKGEISLLSSMMLVKNGIPEFTNDNEKKQKRLLIEYADGTIAILSSSIHITTNDAVKLALASGDVKYAVYMDTGSYDSAFYYEPDGQVHQLGWRESNKEVSNLLILSVKSEKINDKETIKPKIISREEWEARKAKDGAYFTEYKETDLKDVLTSIVIHHSLTSGGPKEIQNVEMDSMGYDDIAYHFVIGKDGTIYEGRKINIMGSHAGQSKEANEEANNARLQTTDSTLQSQKIDQARQKDPDYGAIGIVLDGTFHDEKPTKEQQETLAQLLVYLKKEYDIPSDNIMPHKHVRPRIIENQGLTFEGKCENTEYFCTLCPGHEGIKTLKTIKDILPPDSKKAKNKLK